MDPFKPQFTVKNLSDSMPGLNENLMQNWFVRKVITIQDKSPGRGRKRLYSFHEALQVEFVHQMTSQGETTKVASPVALQCADFYCHELLNKQVYSPEEPYVGQDYVVLYQVAPKIRCRFIMKNDFNILDIGSIHYRIFDFHYCAWRLYETIMDVAGQLPWQK
ncbi:hypothetical protein DPQ33_12600 [Oceanidesulfovibrio indonesiensis]|uniref:HTH merR-type domain-containing protein n=1 Tax=Oceanidesulfovibrio indonesiensis TaxID=54767 RepID=A0A7M3MD83_9BACT|nr:hypothetical protein [Oceanidesulfovibrio indonesiensis]TVM16445.1 hypothetical protein DPQ33_12600 [Oceanidesulfovibrio indonesiensis]